MAAPKESKSKPKVKPSPPRTKPYIKQLKVYAKNHATYTTTIKVGCDKNKVNQAEAAINRGKHTYVARQCSAHIRTVFPPNLLQDNETDDFCINSRSNNCMDNECKLCGIENHENWVKCKPFNIAQAVGGTLKDMIYYFGTDYPNNKDYTVLRVKKNGAVIIDYYIKLIPFTSVVKTSAPSGYKYKDRCSVSKFTKIQSNNHGDVILCIGSEDVHCVGFWNLLKDGGLKKLIQILKEKPLGVFVWFLVDSYSDVGSIDVELIVNRNDMKGKDRKIIKLWHWARDTNAQSNNYQNDDNISSTNNYGASRASVTTSNNDGASRASVVNVRNNPLGRQQYAQYNNDNGNYGIHPPFLLPPYVPTSYPNGVSGFQYGNTGYQLAQPQQVRYGSSTQQYIPTQQMQQIQYDHPTQIPSQSPIINFDSNVSPMPIMPSMPFIPPSAMPFIPPSPMPIMPSMPIIPPSAMPIMPSHIPIMTPSLDAFPNDSLSTEPAFILDDIEENTW